MYSLRSQALDCSQDYKQCFQLWTHNSKTCYIGLYVCPSVYLLVIFLKFEQIFICILRNSTLYCLSIRWLVGWYPFYFLSLLPLLPRCAGDLFFHCSFKTVLFFCLPFPKGLSYGTQIALIFQISQYRIIWFFGKKYLQYVSSRV